MNIVEQMFLWYNEHPLGVFPREVELGLVVGDSQFSEKPPLTSKVAVQLCTPTSNGGAFPCSTSVVLSSSEQLPAWLPAARLA